MDVPLAVRKGFVTLARFEFIQSTTALSMCGIIMNKVSFPFFHFSQQNTKKNKHSDSPLRHTRNTKNKSVNLLKSYSLRERSTSLCIGLLEKNMQ